MLAEWGKCPDCGTDLRDDSEPLQIGGALEWTWLDGRRLEVTASRCLGCAALELARRDFQRSHEKRKHMPRIYSPGDGIKWRVEVLRGEAVSSGYTA